MASSNGSNDSSIWSLTKKLAKNPVAGGIVTGGVYLGAHVVGGFLVGDPAGAIIGAKIAVANVGNAIVAGTVGSAA